MTLRAKILLALVALAGGLAAATLFGTQRVVTRVQRATAAEAFERDVAFAGALQAARLAGVRATCLDLARSVRLVAALDEGDAAILYRIALDELREVMRPAAHVRAASFFRLLGPDGRVLRPDDERAGLLRAGGAEAAWERDLARAGAPAPGAPVQEVGYLAPEVDGVRALHEVVLTRIVDPVAARPLGTLVLGFAMEDPGAGADAIVPMPTGIWLEGRLFSRTIPATLAPALSAALDAAEPVVSLDGVPHRVFVRAVGESPALPPARQVGLYSLGPLLAAERQVRDVVLLLGTLALAVAILAGTAIARGLTGPVMALVRGAREIEQGRFDVRVPVRRDDEIGRLSAAFNEMASGLELRDRYRSLLDMVADKRVADELIAGGVSLGGEIREVTVLFCDVCSFTSLTEPMAPTEVIELLNAHMATMTEIIHRHGGVVDKFIGDGIMALFGAPTSTGSDADAALDAARDMVAARAAANAGVTHPLEVHVGIASGSVVAGCMGSPARLAYTVLGARVNLAARLCGQAGPMEIVIDEATRTRLRRTVALDEPADLALKGFSSAVAAYRVAS